MTSRDAILAKVKAGVQAQPGKDNFAARRQAAEARLTARPRGPQPKLASDLAQRFRAKAEAMSSTVDNVAALAEAPAAVARYLAAGNLGKKAVVARQHIADLDWQGAGLEVEARSAVDADTVGITGCFCAIAETGTIMLLSGPDTPATVSLLPETHIAIVAADRIVPTLEDAFALVRSERGHPPRAVNLVSGPSRTGDIEQTIVLGAHGPCRVHLVVVA